MSTKPKHADTIYTDVPVLQDKTSIELSLQEWSDSVHSWAISKGWWEEGASKTFTECMMLAVTELSEAVEEFRDGRPFDKIYFIQDDEGNAKPEGIPVEIADTFIRLFDTVAAFGIPLETAISLKQRYNQTRSHRHGGKKI